MTAQVSVTRPPMAVLSGGNAEMSADVAVTEVKQAVLTGGPVSSPVVCIVSYADGTAGETINNLTTDTNGGCTADFIPASTSTATADFLEVIASGQG